MIASLLVALCAAPAHATGVGSSVGVARGETGQFYPSLDLHFEPILLQIHVMEFLLALETNDVQLGANIYGTAHEAEFGGPWTGVVQPGAGLDLYVNNDTALDITAELRLGAQVSNARGGFGIYVVPALGLAIGQGDNPLIAGGGLQISAWFGN